jgi:2-dehydropantoate 2-reductase
MTVSPHWHILGAGALGGLFAGTMQSAGLTATLLTHRDQPQTLRVTLLPGNGSASEAVLDVPVCPLPAMPKASVDHLLMTTKAFAVGPALREVLPWLTRDARVVCCANGIGFEAEAQALLGARPLLRAVTTEAALRSGPKQVTHSGHGETLVGDGRSPQAPAWFQTSLGQLPGWRWVADTESAVRRKFAVNCAINALTTVHRCRNGELLQRPELTRVFEALCVETEEALRRLRLWSGDETLLEVARGVCMRTAENRSSMLQDRLAGRRCEIDYLNGHLLALAAEAGLELPVNEQLVRELHREERG